MNPEIWLEANKWLDLGVATIPLLYPSRDKKPDGRALWKVGNKGGSWEPYKTRLCTRREIDCWYGSTIQRNLGVVLGWNGLLVLDFDNIDWFFPWRQHYPKIRTRMLLTPRPGMHVYLWVGEPARNRKLKAKGIEIKSMGTYVMAPPSIHPSGRQYWPVDDSPILRVDQLEDIFPFDWLEGEDNSQQEQPAAVIQTPMAAAKTTRDDPWQSAINAEYLEYIDFAKIKSRFTVEQFMSSCNPIRTASGTISVDCPFHEDHNHSGYIVTSNCTQYARYPGYQSFFCQRCNPDHGWDAINVYARLRGLSLFKAANELAKML